MLWSGCLPKSDGTATLASCSCCSTSLHDCGVNHGQHWCLTEQLMTLLGLKILTLMIVEETKNFKSKALQEVVREEKRHI